MEQRSLFDLTEHLEFAGVVGVMLWIDSPGGSVSGRPELADQIMRARSKKPVIVLVDTLAASAAY